MAGYRDLKVWQSAMWLAEAAYHLSEKFPRHEMYGLASQLQRSAVSVPSNIAEGYGRNSDKAFHHFLGIALGSLAELETQILLAQRLNYLAETDITPVLLKTDELGKMLKGLQKSLSA